jgi:hypothetical protein
MIYRLHKIIYRFGITGGITENDYDPVLLSYMGGTFANGKFSTPRALMSVVDTDLSPGGSGTSTGKYFVSTPNLAVTPKITWSATGGPQGIRFVDGSGPNPNPLLGNPYGLVQAGQYMHLNEYDNTKIYTINIPSFEAATTDTYTIANADIMDVIEHLPAPPTGYFIHAASFSVLTDFSLSTPVSYLYAMYNYLSPASPTEPTTYLSGVIARFTLDSTGRIDGNITPVHVRVGKNAQGMRAFPGGVDGITIAVDAIGGPRNYGTTNGSDSKSRNYWSFQSATSRLILSLWQKPCGKEKRKQHRICVPLVFGGILLTILKGYNMGNEELEAVKKQLAASSSSLPILILLRNC